MSWIVVNSEPLMEFDMPTLHKVVEVGGLGVHKPKPLDAVGSTSLQKSKIRKFIAVPERFKVIFKLYLVRKFCSKIWLKF